MNPPFVFSFSALNNFKPFVDKTSYFLAAAGFPVKKLPKLFWVFLSSILVLNKPVQFSYLIQLVHQTHLLPSRYQIKQDQPPFFDFLLILSSS